MFLKSEIWVCVSQNSVKRDWVIRESKRIRNDESLTASNNTSSLLVIHTSCWIETLHSIGCDIVFGTHSEFLLRREKFLRKRLVGALSSGAWRLELWILSTKICWRSKCYKLDCCGWYGWLLQVWVSILLLGSSGTGSRGLDSFHQKLLGFWLFEDVQTWLRVSNILVSWCRRKCWSLIEFPRSCRNVSRTSGLVRERRVRRTNGSINVRARSWWESFRESMGQSIFHSSTIHILLLVYL